MKIISFLFFLILILQVSSKQQNVNSTLTENQQKEETIKNLTQNNTNDTQQNKTQTNTNNSINQKQSQQNTNNNKLNVSKKVEMLFFSKKSVHLMVSIMS